MNLLHCLTRKRVLVAVATLLLGAWPGTADAEVFNKGTLTANSPISNLRAGCYCTVYNVKLTAGTVYTIDLRSTDFDAYLYLLDDFGGILAQDDDSGGGLDARIVIRATYTGQHQIVVTTFGQGMRGNFTLLVRP
jgi:hypothetical protein